MAKDMKEQKNMIVVGGTGQIGKAIIKSLNGMGFHTISISKNEIEETEKYSGTDYCFFDMSDVKEIDECCRFILQTYGYIYGLINVIGKNGGGSVEEITEEIWDDVMDTNLKSVFFISQTFKKLFRINSEGIIINFASTAGIRALPKSPHYIAAKAGVIALTKYFARVFAPDIRVNCIAPGFVLTENHLPENYVHYSDIIAEIPLGRMVDKEEIADAVIYLLNGKGITGHVLVIDGGLIL